LRRLGLPVLLCADAVSQGRGGDALDLPDLFRQILRDAPRHVGHHHPGGTEGGELLLHQGQPLAGLCGVRQVLRDVVADADPVPGEQAEQQRTRVQEKDQLPLIHDHRGQPHKKGWFFSVFAHSFSSFRQSRSHHGSGEIRLPSHRIRQTSAVVT
ncbi:Ribosome maturation factor RimP, partial [Dysosmobacter welbionis]